MTKAIRQIQRWPWTGFFGGVIFWYAAHDLGLYFSGTNCLHRWILPTVHLIALVGAIWATWVSFFCYLESDRQVDDLRSFSTAIGFASGALFALVILWQGIATLIFSGCQP